MELQSEILAPPCFHVSRLRRVPCESCPCPQEELLARASAVKLLAARGNGATGTLRKLLTSMDSMDSCVAALGRVSKPATGALIKQVLRLHHNLTQAKRLQAVLQGSDCESNQVLSRIGAHIASDGVDEVLAEIELVLNDDVSLQGSAEEQQQSLCFALKTGLNADLDIVRELYVSNVNEVTRLVEEYQTRCEWSCCLARV
jgi:DNA mismatch repair ATPase MutS